jgi:quercetin 2,3-dioxygenase
MGDLDPTWELLEGRDVVLGGTRNMPVVRTLPNKERRMVGAWCFVDHYIGQDPMRVPPHPHTGLQTVTWLVEGEVRHTDSVGSDQTIRPGQLNLMTAGRGIAHAEQSPAPMTAGLHGVQLWVALPGSDRATEPTFAHHADLPEVTDGSATLRVLLGEVDGARSPARAYTPIVGAEVAFAGAGSLTVPLRADFEYAALTLTGAVDVADGTLPDGPLLYLGAGRSSLALRAPGPARLLLIGGEPYPEEIIMWWNFIGRSHDEIVGFREDWMAGRGFGAPVRGYDGEPLPAPEMPMIHLKPRGRLRYG